MSIHRILLATHLIVVACLPASADERTYLSHPPQRPLPVASNRPQAEGVTFYVDTGKGSDDNDGSIQRPWKTASHAVQRLKPGATLCFRAGTYYDQIKVPVSGTADKPITLRAHPGELVVIDAGHREFFDTPQTAWEPVKKGAPGEYRSTVAYPSLERAVGNFGDSLIPFHSYKFDFDFRAQHEALQKVGSAELASFYLGPGLWYDTESKRIHVRLSHTHIKAFGSGNYRGETDPRKLPLVISGWNRTPLTLEGVSHVRIQDLVFRGGGDSTILVKHCKHIEFDGVTLFNAKAGLRVETTGPLRVVHCAFRGTMPPWGSRSASKGRTVNSHLFVPMGTYKHLITEREYLKPQCHDFEIAHCEFTDGHDGAYVGGVKRLTFHHNLVENMNDDGVYLSAWGPPGSDVKIYQNRLARCLTMFAFGLGRGSESEPGKGTYIYHNLIDQLTPVPYGHPHPEAERLTSYGRLVGDHGGPTWEPMFFYHNTVLVHGPPFRSYYGAGLGGHTHDKSRHVMNNIFVQVDGLLGSRFLKVEPQLLYDANLHWSCSHGPTDDGNFLAKFHQSKEFTSSKQHYASGWTAHDRFADPRLVALPTMGSRPLDSRLQHDSPAINAGLELPKQWPTVSDLTDSGKPDLGAYPAGSKLDLIGPTAGPRD